MLVIAALCKPNVNAARDIEGSLNIKSTKRWPELVKLANTFQSEIWVEFEEDEVNGKSIMGLMMLAAPSGSEIHVSAKGEDAEAALLALGNLVEGGFEEN